MSLAGSLQNALSGLAAVSRATEVVSSNTSNAMTEGYARRELSLSSLSLGSSSAGVRVEGVNRVINQSILNERRLAEAEAAGARVKADFLQTLESTLGAPGDAGSLSTLLASFDAALIDAASRPDSEARLASVLHAATAVADKLKGLSGHIEDVRSAADTKIAAEVGVLNDTLALVKQLNTEILRQGALGHDANALKDQRQALVDKIASIVPIREVARDNDQIALFTTGGAILLDGSAAVVGFNPVGLVTADMDVDAGVLSGLTINGNDVALGDRGLLAGGSLSALFTLRDTLAPEAQTQIDALARDMISRFSTTSADPTLAPGAPGLFTDMGGLPDPSDEQGLAGRIRINTLADPATGGALWKLRDGLGATSPGDVGDATRLNALGAALTAPLAPASGSFIGATRSASGLASDVLSQISGARQIATAELSFTASREETLRMQQLSDGVDTDAEMQRLLQIEQAYAANARVIQAIDAMLQRILEI